MGAGNKAVQDNEPRPENPEVDLSTPGNLRPAGSHLDAFHRRCLDERVGTDELPALLRLRTGAMPAPKPQRRSRESANNRLSTDAVCLLPGRLRGADANSDHFLVIANIILTERKKVKQNIHRNKNTKYDMKELQVNEVLRRYKADIERSLDNTPVLNMASIVEKKWNNIDNTIKTSTGKNINKKKRRKEKNG
ncbi:unnamed protein product [Psylliodes chrysocephalus]|uniref:Uncharacterized protein n=1 Tax=Psylliodes chrysocephalus TaxID=3402493 RepID=A0A9P0D635_9CUCU|nr:unnamed protein product [Psylliodes chrysocephala]